MDRVEEMPVYQLFFALALDVEKATRHFKADFLWLRIQVLKSSESVCANMAEGFYAQYSTEYVQALYRCRREARESMVHIRYATSTGRLAADVGNDLLVRYEEGTKQLGSLITSIERKIGDRGKSKPTSSYVRESEAEYDTSLPDPTAADDELPPITH